MHVAVLGAGYAGLSLARKLERRLPETADLTLVDERDTHLVQHLIHRTIRYPSMAAELRVPLEEVLERATHRQGRIEALDVDAETVELDDGSLSYDVGAVCLGARTDFHDLPGVEEHATPLKRLEHASRIRERFLEVCASEGRAVVCGAGLSGIQAAGELAELAREEQSDAEVRLVERLDAVAPSFPRPFRDAVAAELDDRGVVVETGRAVEAATDETLTFADGEERAYDQLVWTGGIAGQSAVDGRRPRMRADLRLGERTFAAGDAARVVDADGQLAPASAQTAVSQAEVAATNVVRLATDDGDGFAPQMERYRFSELGWLVSVGDGAVAQVGSSVLRGSAATALKTSVGAGYLGSVGAVRNAAEYVWGEVGTD